jgi:hypothetical protein
MAADVHVAMDHDPERRGLSQTGKLLFVLFVALCAIFTWILLVAHGWWLAVLALCRSASSSRGPG